MDNFISTLIFTLPGLMCYYWLLWFGFSPSQKHTPFESLGISALLWLPVAAMSLIYFNFISIVESFYISYIFKTGEKLLPFITNLTQIKAWLEQLWFIIYFLISSVFFSYFFSRIWAEKIFDRLLKHINNIRSEKMELSKLSKKQTVWEEIFLSSEAKVVKVAKLDKPEEYIIGSIRKTSRPLELERNIALDEIDYFTRLVEKYNPTIKLAYIDTKSGISIHMYHPNSIKEAQEKDHSSNDPIISPWVSE